jgi:cell fate regulator YaaT (PSP1 superfamily)
MATIVGLKLRKKLLPFDADAGELDLREGDKVMVEDEGAPVLATVVARSCCRHLLPDTVKPSCRKILRRAEEADIRQEELNVRMEKDYFRACHRKIVQHNLPMKLVEVAIEPDGSKVVFFFVAENRVDFRALVKELASELRTRIEMRQIGARTEAQVKGGLGCCGRELCCTGFLKKFCPVTVKMTKEQGLPLDPEKISGVCGRLMCCLAYEYDTYVRMKEGLPKVGKRIQTAQGLAKVRQVNVIAHKLVIELEDGSITDMSIDDYKPEMLVRQQGG